MTDRQVSTRSEAFLSALIATCLFLVLHQVHRATYFPWDSNGYWGLSDPAVFFNYPKEIRGYFYPLLLMPAHFLSNVFVGYELYPYRVSSSLAYGYLLSNFVPTFYVRVFGGKLSLARRLLLPILVAILLPGLIIYPLSDLPAFLMLVGSIAALMKARAAKTTVAAGALTVLGGALGAGAYNTRTIYLFPLLLIFCALPLHFFSGRPAKDRVVAVAAFLAGAVLLCIPQSLINHSTYQKWTPAVISQKTDKSLFALQLMWGITIQRYETTIDTAARSASRHFMDRAGEKLFAAENLEKGDVSVANYASIVARHPMEFAGIYGRHLINGLDLRDGEVYVRHADRVHNKIALFNFIVVALGLLAALIRYSAWKQIHPAPGEPCFGDRAEAEPTWPLWGGILLLPVLAVLPGAIETRFFLPLHMLLYCTIAFNTNIAESMVFVKRHCFAVLLGVGLLGALFFATSTATMASMQDFIHPPYRFGQ